MIAGNNTPPSGVVCLVQVFVVSLRRSSGVPSSTPQHVIPGRGSRPRNELGGSTIPALGTSLGATLRVSHRPRNRMGLGRFARQHARHQFERNVHRSPRYVVGRRRLHSAPTSPSARQTRLPGKARRTWPRHGRLGGACRVREPESLQRSSFLTHSPRPLKRLILDWTLFSAKRCVHSIERAARKRVRWGSFDSHNHAKWGCSSRNSL